VAERFDSDGREGRVNDDNDRLNDGLWVILVTVGTGRDTRGMMDMLADDNPRYPGEGGAGGEYNNVGVRAASVLNLTIWASV